MSDAKPRLYGYFKGDRSGRVRWLFDELGIDYDSEFVDFRNPAPEHVAVHPLVWSPTLVAQGRTQIESAAICLHWAETHRERVNLVPAETDATRGEFLQWLFFVSSSLDPLHLQYMWLKFGGDPAALEARKPGIVAMVQERCEVLETLLKSRPYLAGERFTVADIVAGTVLSWFQWDEFLPEAKYPALLAYTARLHARESVKRIGIFAD